MAHDSLSDRDWLNTNKYVDQMNHDQRTFENIYETLGEVIYSDGKCIACKVVKFWSLIYQSDLWYSPEWVYGVNI